MSPPRFDGRGGGGSWLDEGVEETLRLLRSLRAVRRFLSAPVPEDVVGEIVEVARWTGSARNRQPWRVMLVTDPAKRSSLARLGAYASLLEQAPLVVLLAVDLELGAADAEFDAGRFAQSVMLAAHAHGLGSCPVSFFPAANIRVATAMTGLREPWQVRTAIAIGYPDPTPPVAVGKPAIPTGRLPLADLIVGDGARRTDPMPASSPPAIGSTVGQRTDKV